MKKILSLILFLFLTACAHEQEKIEIKNIQPVVKKENLYVNTQSTYNNCNTCTTSYTVRKPIEVIYENTTYTTVYEPKIYTTITHERKPYNKCENSDLCY